MGKTRDLFQKIRDTKGIFYAKMGSIKDRNGMDITEAEDIKKMWQEYTEIVGGAWGWCTVMTQRDVIGREVGGGFMFGNACTPVVDSSQCMAKPIQYCN